MPPDDIENAQKLGGNPYIELADRTAASSLWPQFVIRNFIPRSNDSQLVARRDNQRLLALRQLFEISGGSTQSQIWWPEVVANNGWSKSEGEEILFFLKDRGLLELTTFGPNVKLTRIGIDEIENTIRYPNQATRNFSSITVQHIINNDNSNHSITVSNSTVGAFQNGNGNTANVQQHFGANTSEIVSLLQEAKLFADRLPQTQRVEAYELISTLEEQTQSETPKNGLVKACVDGLIGLLTGVATPVAIDGLKAYFRIP